MYLFNEMTFPLQPKFCFQGHLPPIPISFSDTVGPFTFMDTECPITPCTRSSRDVLISTVAPYAILKSPLTLTKMKKLAVRVDRRFSNVSPAHFVFVLVRSSHLLCVFVENFLEGLFKQGRIERVTHDHQTSRLIDDRLETGNKLTLIT